MAAKIAGQGSQVAGNRCDLLIGQSRIELSTAHSPDGVFQRRRAAVMEIRRGDSDVSQAGDTQHLGLAGSQATENAVAGEQVAADSDTLMARNASDGRE